jgi:hypothetical protein
MILATAGHIDGKSAPVRGLHAGDQRPGLTASLVGAAMNTSTS